MNTSSISSGFSDHSIRRVIIFSTLFVIELVSISIQFDAGSIMDSSSSLLSLLQYSNELIQITLCFLGVWALISWPHRQQILILVNKDERYPQWPLALSIHLVSLLLFVFLSYRIFSDSFLVRFNIEQTLLFWMLSGIALSMSLAAAIFPPHTLIKLLIQERFSLLVAMPIAMLFWGGTQISMLAWEPLSGLTFNSVAWLLKFAYHNIYIDPNNKIIGTYAFKAEISPECSGYEGIGMILLFTALFIYLYRNELRFPNIFLLFPLGICVIWLLNIFRLIILIAIGSSLSPTLAAGGFHSNAGWITFLITSIGIMINAYTMPFFTHKPNVITLNKKPPESIIAIALLLPMVILMATVLFCNLLKTQFDWLYPLRIIIPGMVLWKFRPVYAKFKWAFSSFAFLIGLTIFFIWVIWVPDSDSDNRVFSENLFSQPAYIVAFWLLLRCIGIVIIIPIIEELAFRGYLLAKLTNPNFITIDPPRFTWFAFLLSSLLFGLFHQHWQAATTAGIGYAWVRYQTGSLWASITAHMTTNLLLAIYILYTQKWSLW